MCTSCLCLCGGKSTYYAWVLTHVTGTVLFLCERGHDASLIHPRLLLVVAHGGSIGHQKRVRERLQLTSKGTKNQAMSRFSASPIVAAFACANVVGPPNEEDDIIGMVVQEMAEELRARAEDADTQDVEQEENLGVLEDRLPHQKRSLQQVVTISSHRETVRWMMTEFDANGKKELISKAVAKFPKYF